MTDNDQASVEALTRILDEQERVMPSPHPTQAEKIRAILDAIRNGEVPLPEDAPRIAALRAELSACRADLSGDPRTMCDRVADSMRSRERELEVERDQLRAEVAKLSGLSEFAPPGHPLHSCGGPQEACMQPGCTECGMPTMEEALAMKSDGERAVMEERNRTAKAAAERDRLAGLLAESRRRLQGFYRNPPAQPIARDLLIRIDAALAEIGGGK